MSSVSRTVRDLVFARWGDTCIYCGRFYGRPCRQRSVDHVMPASRGGTKSLTNLVGACAACNMAKGNRTPAEWAFEILIAAGRIEAANAMQGGEATDLM